MQTETLIEKIRNLPPERVNEIEDFIDFILERNSRSTRHDAITEYAAKHGGGIADFDAELEAASLEHMFDTEGHNP